MSEENVFLLYAFFSGILITSVYDILRIWRRVLPHKGLLVSLEDLAFWIFCALYIFGLMHRESNGSLRWFAVIGALAGMLLYKKTVSGLLVRYISLILCRVRDILCTAMGFCLRPVGRAGHAASGAVGRLLKKCRIFCKNRLKNYKKLLKIKLKKQ
ncbi:MAG: spore cortex biosynthesis protein YabQ [Acetatifactor sp.]